MYEQQTRQAAGLVWEIQGGCLAHKRLTYQWFPVTFFVAVVSGTSLFKESPVFSGAHTCTWGGIWSSSSNSKIKQGVLISLKSCVYLKIIKQKGRLFGTQNYEKNKMVKWWILWEINESLRRKTLRQCFSWLKMQTCWQKKFCHSHCTQNIYQGCIFIIIVTVK